MIRRFIAPLAAVTGISCAMAPVATKPPKPTSDLPPSQTEGYRDWHTVAEEHLRKVPVVIGYRGWAKVNPVPALMDPIATWRCVGPIVTTPDPHAFKYVTVHVNEVGRQAMMQEVPGPFPVGSVIVKEKLAGKEAKEPELLTFMIKREKGFNPNCGDWEFGVYQPGPSTALSVGKLKDCQSCHVDQDKHDFVYATYRPRSAGNTSAAAGG